MKRDWIVTTHTNKHTIEVTLGGVTVVEWPYEPGDESDARSNAVMIVADIEAKFAAPLPKSEPIPDEVQQMLRQYRGTQRGAGT